MQAPLALLQLCYQRLMKAVLIRLLMRPKLNPFTVTCFLASRL